MTSAYIVSVRESEYSENYVATVQRVSDWRTVTIYRDHLWSLRRATSRRSLDRRYRRMERQEARLRAMWRMER